VPPHGPAAHAGTAEGVWVRPHGRGTHAGSLESAGGGTAPSPAPKSRAGAEAGLRGSPVEQSTPPAIPIIPHTHAPVKTPTRMSARIARTARPCPCGRNARRGAHACGLENADYAIRISHGTWVATRGTWESRIAFHMDRGIEPGDLGFMCFGPCVMCPAPSRTSLPRPFGPRIGWDRLGSAGIGWDRLGSAGIGWDRLGSTAGRGRAGLA